MLFKITSFLGDEICETLAMAPNEQQAIAGFLELNPTHKFIMCRVCMTSVNLPLMTPEDFDDLERYLTLLN